MSIKPEHKIVALAFLGGAFMWLMDAILDKFHKFPEEPFIQVLLHDAPNHEFWMRPIFLCSFTLFGLLIAFYMKKMKQSELRYHRLFDSINDMVLLRPLQQGIKEKFIEANPAASKKLGYTREEFLQLSPADLVAPDKLAEFSALNENFTVKGHILFETAMVTKDGQVMPVELNAHALEFNGKPSVLCMMRDITERKQREMERLKAEECLRDSERQLRVLATRLLEVQESERGRISKELHDELGQSLLLMKLQLNAVMDHLRKDQGKLLQECAHILTSMDTLIEDIRRLVRELSPKVLEELGLTSAIKLLLEELSRHYNIDTSSIDFETIDHLFPTPIQLVIYRIFQESLTNIGKHAKASQVSASIKKLDNRVMFSIQDNGRGFNPEKLHIRDKGIRGIGLPTMSERIRFAGGQLDIKSQEGMGTEIAFSVPVGEEEEKEGVLSNRLGG